MMKNITLVFMLILFGLGCFNQQVEKKKSPNHKMDSYNKSSKEEDSNSMPNEEDLAPRYANGQLKEKGKYEYGEYAQCCFSGPCNQSYRLKTGDWEYFYSNSTIKAKGKYVIKTLNLQTSCQGGADLLFGLIDDNWEVYNEENMKIEISDSMRIELEKVSIGSNSGVYWVPNKEKNEIERVRIE